MDLRHLLATAEHLPGDVRRDVCSLGDTAVPFLVRLLDDDVRTRRSTRAAAHAARLLADLRAEAAIEPLVRRLSTIDMSSARETDLTNALFDALTAFGERSVEPLLSAMHHDLAPEVHHMMCEALTRIGVRDARIEAHVVRVLDDAPALGAILYCDYSPDRAAPRLLAKLRELVPQGNRARFDVNELVQELGGIGVDVPADLADGVREILGPRAAPV